MHDVNLLILSMKISIDKQVIACFKKICQNSETIWQINNWVNEINSCFCVIINDIKRYDFHIMLLIILQDVFIKSFKLCDIKINS